MKQIAEYIVAMVFSVFFLIGGAGFTLSHYCCNKCKTMHNAQCTMHNTLSKHCECCWVLHFEVDTTETTPAFCLPDRAENDLFGLFYPPAIHLVSTWYPPYFRLMRRATFTHRHWRQIQITPKVYCGVFAAG